MKLAFAKALTLLVAFGLFAGVVSAQSSYTLNPGHSVTAALPADSFAEPQILALNNGSTDLWLDYQVISNTLDTNWSILFCYRGGCFNNVVNSAPMDSILPGDEKMIFKITFDPQGYPGTGGVSMRVWSRQNPGVEDTLSIDFEVTPAVVGISEELLEQVKVFPQPVEDLLHIDRPASLGRVELNILDLSGALVARQMAVGSQTSLDVSALAKGMYILQIRNEDVTLNKRFVVQ